MKIRSLYIRTCWRIKELLAPKYTGGGLKQMKRIPSHELVYRIFDYVHSRTSYDAQSHDRNLAGLNAHERAFWYAWDVDCEVTNGGFNQYFFNKLSRPTTIILESYRILGAKEHESIFQAALEARRFVAESHVDVLKAAQGRTEDILAGFSRSYIDNPLNELDMRYYSIKPEMADILVEFAQRNERHFKSE